MTTQEHARKRQRAQDNPGTQQRAPENAGSSESARGPRIMQERASKITLEQTTQENAGFSKNMPATR
eukprot:2936987-Alexandrium_andersonii.AAC.1